MVQEERVRQFAKVYSRGDDVVGVLGMPPSDLVASVFQRHPQAAAGVEAPTAAHRDAGSDHAAQSKVEEDGSDGRAESAGRSAPGADSVVRLRLAKALSFSSGAGMVAWNKFSSLWLLSVGLTPTGLSPLTLATDVKRECAREHDDTEPKASTAR